MPAPNSPGAGQSKLLYDYTVTAATKASIDTNVDGPGAGLLSDDFALLEVWFVGRSDKSANTDNVNFTFNNDTGANYDTTYLDMSGTAVSGGAVNATTSMSLTIPAASLAANQPGIARLSVPNYAGTTFHKIVESLSGTSPQSSTGREIDFVVEVWRSTAAINRIKAASPANNFVAGSRLLVYGR